MKQNKVIAIFLLMVLCIQLLPLRQTIAWLLRNQVTEEIVHADDGKGSRFADELHKLFLPALYPLSVKMPVSTYVSSLIRSEALIARHADDILTPPPNC